MVDDVAYQDQAGTVTRIARYRVGIEHHRKTMAVGDAGEDRDDFVVAFKGMNVDDATATGSGVMQALANEILDAGFCEHVGQFLLRHPLRLDPEERVEQPLDLGVGGGEAIAIARQHLQLAFLALEAAAQGMADPRGGRRARHDRHQGTVVDRGLARQQRHRIRQIPPPQRLLAERQNISLGALAYRRNQRVEIGAGRLRGKIPVPQRHVEGGVLAAHETCDANAVRLAERERKQQQRPAFAVIGNNDEGPKALALSDQLLPGAKEIEPLIRRGEMLLMFEAAPDRSRPGRGRRENRRWRCGLFSTTLAHLPSGFRSRQPWSSRNLSTGNYLHFSALADLCKEMSTKSNDNPPRRGGNRPHRSVGRPS